MNLRKSHLNIGFVLLAVLFLHTVESENFYYRPVDERCIHDCNILNKIPNVTFSCDGHNKSCDWQCASQRMGCDEGLAYHCAKDFHNYEIQLDLNEIEYKQACAPERFCKAGEEPYVTFSYDDMVRSLRNAKINCVHCTDQNFYNSQVGRSSASYSRCFDEKFNKCIPEDNKIDCGISWRERKDTDGYCRCDARNGYAPENEAVKTKCFYSNELCVPKTCPQPSQELLLNYTCADKCPSGMQRTEEADECVSESVQTKSETVTSTKRTAESMPKEIEKGIAAGLTTVAQTGWFNGKQKVHNYFNTTHIAGHNIVSKGKNYHNQFGSVSQESTESAVETEESCSFVQPSQKARTDFDIEDTDGLQEHSSLLPNKQHGETSLDNTTTVTIETANEISDASSGSNNYHCDIPVAEACNTPDDESVPRQPMIEENIQENKLKSKKNNVHPAPVVYSKGAILCQIETMKQMPQRAESETDIKKVCGSI
ncbi:uncharacterized protein LOC128212922 isoform X2 [Mya arenaria]|uniref:uncharacterized protein LOC128212922 isoform X2 n=1 Tax=Mya arenaria TaxID=6604 RepID=UPI0022E9240E|nr:uncharacterized protein LOC128212922 isoform X2 [Mya arenaria]